MSLRPRYSLLTLLVLTAIIAGGVKLWYGPHRVVMSDPPNAEEANLINKLDFSRHLKTIYPPVVYEYEYLNEWNGRKYLHLRGYSTGARPIPVYQSSERPGIARLLYRWEGETQTQLAIELEDAKKEFIVCWFYQPRAHNKEIDLSDVQSRFPYEKNSAPIKTKCYFLSSRRKLYLFYAASTEGMLLKAIELNEIDDLELRRRLAMQLVNVPNVQNPQ